MKKKLSIVVVILGILGICGWGYYQSTPPTMDRLVNAIQKKDLKTVKKYLPEYSDHSKIDKSAYQAFMETDPSQKQIRHFLTNDCQLVNHGMFKSKLWEPQKRAISISGLDDVSGTTVTVANGKQVIPVKNMNHVNLFPGKYQLTLKMNNSAYGTVKKSEKVDLTQDNQNIVLSPEVSFEKSNRLHQTLVESFSAFLVSWNKAIPTMNFNNLPFATSSESKLLNDTYNDLKEVSNSYSNEFDKVTLDNSSVEIQSYGAQPTVKFTAFVDRKQTLNLDQDQANNDQDTSIRSNDGTVDVTMVYSEKSGHWEVDDADFDVGSENPDEWNDKCSFVIPKGDQQGSWNKSTAGQVNI